MTMVRATAAIDAGRGDAFRVRGLTKIDGSGAGEVQALRGVDLDVHTAETLVLLGLSGSGKSTLLSILGGLDRATSGHVHFRDRDLARASTNELTQYRRAAVGFIFQFFNLIPSLTAGNVVIVYPSDQVSDGVRVALRN